MTNLSGSSAGHSEANEYATIGYAVDETGILLLTLNRPDHLNAFTVDKADHHQR